MSVSLDELKRLAQRVAVLDCANKPGCQGEHAPDCRCGMTPAPVCAESLHTYSKCFACHARDLVVQAHTTPS